MQRWIAEQWNELICSRSSAEDRTNHLWWHLRDGSTRSGKYNPKNDNMQEVRDFAGYFAKYLGKDEKAQAAHDPMRCNGFLDRFIAYFSERIWASN